LGDFGDFVVLVLGDLEGDGERELGELVESCGFSRSRTSTVSDVREGGRLRFSERPDGDVLAGDVEAGGVGVAAAGVMEREGEAVRVRLGELVLATPFETKGLLLFTVGGGGGGRASSSSSSSGLPPNIFLTSKKVIRCIITPKRGETIKRNWIQLCASRLS
jgi:hypothetical protein